MNGIDILGSAAGAVTTLIFLPQVLKTYKEKSAKDVSLNMFLIAAVNQTMWIVYGILKKDKVIFFTNVVVLIMSLIMIFLKLKYGKEKPLER